MLTFTRLAGTRRAGLLLLIVSATSVLTGAAVAGSPVRRAAPLAGTSQIRSVSCHAFDFRPVDGSTGYDYAGEKRIRVGTSGSGFFTCSPGLPDRAVVTKVQFSIWDGSGSSQVRFCGLYRSGLTSLTADSYQELAALPGTGLAQAPGFARLTDTSIKNAAVDTTRFAYWLQCNLEQAGQSLGLFGADVVYTISATNG